MVLPSLADDREFAEAIRLTQSAAHAGTVVGTLPYMAPEILRGEEAGATSDIWSLGVTLFEMSAGHLPFRGQTSFPRNYKRIASLERDAILEMLEDRLRDYDATVVRAKAGEVSAVVGKILAERGKRRVVVPAGLAEATGDASSWVRFVVDSGITSDELDGFEGVVTASTLAIAETGTIVLQNVPGQGRRAPTLIPDYHLLSPPILVVT